MQPPVAANAPDGAARAVPVAAALLLMLVVGTVLARTAPPESVVDMAFPRWEWPVVAMSLGAGPLRPGGDDFHLSLDTADVSPALASDRIELEVANYGIPAHITDARLAVVGTRCLFVARPGQWVTTNARLRFERGSECVPADGASPGRLELTISTDIPSVLGLWVLLPTDSADIPAGALRAPATLGGPATGDVLARGRYVTRDTAPGASYAALLDFLWVGALPGHGLWILLGGLGGLLVAGAALSTRSTRFLQCSAAALVAGSLSGAYAVLSPPLHAPDEAVHFLSFARLNHRPDLEQELEAVHFRNHFERLRARPDQRFRPSDRRRPGTERWPDDVGLPSINYLGRPVDFRSPSIGVYWRALGPLMEGWHALEVLLTLRLLNALYFGLAVGVAAGLTGASGAGLGAFAPLLLCIPTLAFFGMHVSNHALLVSAYVVAAGAVVRVVRTARLTTVTGMAMFGAAALGAITARASVPLSMTWVALLPLRIAPAFDGGTRAGTIRRRLVFWGGVALPACVAAMLAVPDYLRHLELAVRLMSGTRVLLSTGRLLAGIGTLIGVAVLIETLADWLARSVSRRIIAIARGVVLGLGVLVIGALAVMLVLPHVTTVPPLTSYSYSSATRPPLLAYAGHVWSAARALFGGYPPDLLLGWTFWGGFGWLEMPPPLWMISLLSGSLGLLLLLWTWRAVAGRRVGQVAAIVLLLMGLATTLTLYALVTAGTRDLLHGRYLIGWYLVLVAPAAALVMEAGTRRALSTAPVWIVFGLVQAVSVASVLDRYFGP